MNTKEALRDAIDSFGIDIIFEKQRLNALLSDLILDDKKNKHLLELTIKTGIPIEILKILEVEYVQDYWDSTKCQFRIKNKDWDIKLKALKAQFKDAFSLEMTAVNIVFELWIHALEPYPYCIFDENIGSCYYVDSKGNRISEDIYEEACQFSEGLALVSKFMEYDDDLGPEWGYPLYFGFINRSGKEVIPRIYTYAEAFIGGLARVILDGKRGFIDRNGNWIKDEK